MMPRVGSRAGVLPVPSAAMLHDRDTLTEALSRLGSVSAVAREAGVTRQAVQQAIRRHDITFTTPPPARHPERPSDTELARLMQQHRTATAVADVLGVADQTVTRWCTEAGIARPGRGRPRKPAPDTVTNP